VTKTLVLVVDRDDDFGAKGGVETPLIGIDNAAVAAIDLGIVDPEDSDVNALLAAINIYKELHDDGKDVEIALICGDKKVGHKSDSALVDELEIVIDQVRPDRAILVGDGAEDEYVYPIISSRVQIDSVKRVFVKQAPGVEGTLYILSKMLSDPQKRRRFLAPIGALLCMIAFIYIIQGAYAYSVTGAESYIYQLSSPIVIFILGGMVLLYAFSTIDVIVDYVTSWSKYVRSGNLLAAFTVLAIALFIGGIILGMYAVRSDMDNSIFYIALLFVMNCMWPIVFAHFFRDFGRMLNDYISDKKVARSFMVGTVNTFGIAFIIQGGLDFIRNYMGYGSVDYLIVILEVVVGIGLVVVAGLIQASFNKYFKLMAEGADTDAVQ
jgi:putative membrane protein